MFHNPIQRERQTLILKLSNCVITAYIKKTTLGGDYLSGRVSASQSRRSTPWARAITATAQTKNIIQTSACRQLSLNMYIA